MALTHTDDLALLAEFPAPAVADAVDLLESWLDYFAAPDHATPVGEDVVDTVLALAGHDDIALPEAPTAEQVAEARAAEDRRVGLRQALPSLAPTFTRNAPGLLAALLRLATR
jgi:hypothetical protein